MSKDPREGGPAPIGTPIQFLVDPLQRIMTGSLLSAIPGMAVLLTIRPQPGTIQKTMR